MVIPMVIQTILLDPSGAVWTDAASNVSRQDPSGAGQSDAKHLTRNRKVAVPNVDLPAPLRYVGVPPTSRLGGLRRCTAEHVRNRDAHTNRHVDRGPHDL